MNAVVVHGTGESVLIVAVIRQIRPPLAGMLASLGEELGSSTRTLAGCSRPYSTERGQIPWLELERSMALS